MLRNTSNKTSSNSFYCTLICNVNMTGMILSVLDRNYDVFWPAIETYFAAISLFRSRLLSRATKIILYKTLIRPVVSCGAEA